MRVSVLDAEVIKHRSPEPTNDNAGLSFAEPERWGEPVMAAELTDEIEEIFTQYVALPKHAVVTCALWAIHTYITVAALCSPILAITSPLMRCGKTTLLGVLSEIVKKPLPASNITPAALFRAIEKFKPTILIDEADTFLKDHNELRGVINSGHTRRSAFVVRVVGDNHEPTPFSTWSAKTIALIGKLPDTLRDRTIEIKMRRRLPNERIKKLKNSTEFTAIKQRMARWAADNIEAVKDAEPVMPKNLSDRASDNWRELLKIAQVLGGDWPERASQAAEAAGAETGDNDSASIKLLADIRELFRMRNTDQIESSDLVEYLIEKEDRPFCEWKNGKPITARGVARLLAPFGVKPNQYRINDKKCRGYHLADFEAIFSRYIPDLSEASGTQLKNSELEGKSSEVQGEIVPDKKGGITL